MILHPDTERLADLGWRLFPAMQRSRAGCFTACVDEATADLATLALWESKYYHCNCWVVPGGTGVFALDVDVAGPDHAHDGVGTMRDLVYRHAPLPLYPHGRSGGGGHLLVFVATAPVQAGSGKPAPSIDCLAGRCSFNVAPPRHHRTENSFYWLKATWEVAPPPAPAWLLDLLAPPPPPARPSRLYCRTEDLAERALHRAHDAIGAARPGQRNLTLLRHATLAGGYIAGGPLNAEITERELSASAQAVGQTEAQAHSTIAAGFRRGAARPLGGDAQ